MVDFHVAQLKATADKPMADYNAMREGWKAKTIAQFGPLDGTKIAEIKANVGRVYAAINDTGLVNEFKLAMDTTGVGDHPAFIAVMNKLSDFVTEGKHVAGAQPSKFGQAAPGTTERPSAARALYPNNP